MASKGAAWGDEFQLETNKSKSLDDDIVMETDGVLAEVSAENFQEAIGGRFEDVLKKNQKSHEH
jgi:cGMP-dependent protein kinase